MGPKGLRFLQGALSQKVLQKSLSQLFFGVVWVFFLAV